MTETAPPIKVLIVDDHPVVREGLKMLLGATPDVKVVGEAANGRDALAIGRRELPDVVLLDLDLGDDDGVAWVRLLQGVSENTKALILTGFRSRERHEAVLLAGARGVVVKDCPSELLLKAVRKVHAGELWFDRALLEVVVKRAIAGDRAPTTTPAPEASRIATLTEREQEIVTLIGEGLRNEEIGKRLSISEKTVRNHLSAVFEKLGVSDRLELVVYAFKHGLVVSQR